MSDEELSHLIQELREAGPTPAPALLEAILAQGPAAVPPLRGLVEASARAEESSPHGRAAPSEQQAVGWAAALLSQLGDAEATPLLLRLAARWDPVLADLTDMLLRLGDAARPTLHAYLRGELGPMDPDVRHEVVRALAELGYDPESAALLIERLERTLRTPRFIPEVAEMYGYALLAMRAPEAEEILYELAECDPRQQFPETDEAIDLTLARSPRPSAEVPDVVTLLKQRRAWRSLHPETPPEPFTYEPPPSEDPEQQARKRAARQARRAAPPPAAGKPPPKNRRSRRA